MRARAQASFIAENVNFKYLLVFLKRFICRNISLKRDGAMTRSKLERYLSILEVLVSRPLELEIILYQVDEEWGILKEYLDFLILHGLVEKLPLDKKRVVYTVTEKGLALLRTLQGQEYLDEHQNLLLIYEE